MTSTHWVTIQSSSDHVPGGEVWAALSLVDVVDLLGVPSTTSALGRVHGGHVAVLAVCDDRTVAGHASLRLVGSTGASVGERRPAGAAGSANQLEWEAFCGCIARATGQSQDQMAEDAGNGRYFTAEEAVAYGLADRLERPGRLDPPAAGPSDRVPPVPSRLSGPRCGVATPPSPRLGGS